MRNRVPCHLSPKPAPACAQAKTGRPAMAPGHWRWLLGCLCFCLLLGGSPAGAQQIPPAPQQNPPQTPVLNYCYQGRLPQSRLVVVDKSRQRLMVFRYLGEMVLEREYPCSTGTRPGGKLEQGDERTPVGVYFTTHRYQDRKITVFGDKAIHINYPNPLDQVSGRKGDGIYLHGTNQTLRPRSTNGCMVMRNEDLAEVASLISEQITPVVVVERLKLASLDQRIKACDFLRHLESRPFEKEQAQLDPQLALMEPENGAKHNFGRLAPRLNGLASARRALVKNLGLMLVGLDDQWVLLAEQGIKGPGRQEVRVLRRHYLRADQPPQLDLVQDEWILPNQEAARQLDAWAPAAPARMASRSQSSAPATPSVAKPVAAPANPDKEVRHMLELWLKAWQAKKLRYYLTFYDQSFSSGGMNKKKWGSHKAYLNRVYKVIRVQAKDISITMNGSRATVRFTQHYRSDWHRDVGIKTLDLIKRGDKWRITGEKWEPVRQRARQAASGRNPS